MLMAGPLGMSRGAQRWRPDSALKEAPSFWEGRGGLALSLGKPTSGVVPQAEVGHSGEQGGPGPWGSQV